MKPITPDEVGKRARAIIPPFVIKAFNDLIVLNWYNGEAVVSQKDVVAEIKKIEIRGFKTTWLNVEPLYEEYGWTVEYDKPGYNETYDAKFTFRKRQ